ncbi:MAG: hypothetical protein ACI8TP_000310 [Acidimicrobiales bacterium]|jgi:hypothetical protein
MATQLRRYSIADEAGLDRISAWIPNIVAVREKYGFTVDFIYADRENLELVWSVSHTGDFDAALEKYNNSPERAAAFEGFESPVKEMQVSMVDTVV